MKNIWSLLGWSALIFLGLIAINEGWFGDVVLRYLLYGLLFLVAVIILFPLGYYIGRKRIQKDQSILAASDHLLETVQRMKSDGQSYAECMAFLRQSDVSQATAESMMANAVASNNQTAVVIGEVLGGPDVDSFLRYSYQQWQAGALTTLSHAFVAETQTTTVEQFVATYQNILGSVAQKCFALSARRSDEYLMCFIDEGFLLTNQRLYIFHKNCPEPKPRNIFCSEIKSYHVKGSWTFTVRIELHSGETLVLKKLDTHIDELYVKKLL